MSSSWSINTAAWKPSLRPASVCVCRQWCVFLASDGVHILMSAGVLMVDGSNFKVRVRSPVHRSVHDLISDGFYLIAFEVGATTRSETLLAAEALELRAHEQRVPLHALLLTPHTHDLNVLDVLHWRERINVQMIRCFWTLFTWVLCYTPAEGLMSGTMTFMLCCSFTRGEAEEEYDDEEGERGAAAGSFSPFLTGSEEDDGTFLSVACGFGTEFSGGQRSHMEAGVWR